MANATHKAGKTREKHLSIRMNDGLHYAVFEYARKRATDPSTIARTILAGAVGYDPDVHDKLAAERLKK